MMHDLLELMAAPFAACVVLVGIHAYLGMHVIQRRVIFVDLALAQIAALGATFGFLLGVSPHGREAYFFSLGFAVVGAAVFAITRMRHEKIPQEAIIGIVYAVAMATAILVADRAPEGAEHIKETLVGTLLWVTWPTVVKTSVIYALVGALHVMLRKRFFQISFEPDRAWAEGRKVRFWDFIFYMTFAFVITSSVAIAGVLLVFSFLVIPAVIATLFAERISIRLAIGWSVGIAACLVGLVSSYRLDMPTGPTLVASLGVALILAALIFYIRAAENRGNALVKSAAGLAVVAGVVAGVSVFVTSGTFLHIDHEHDWEDERASRHAHEGLDDAWHPPPPPTTRRASPRACSRGTTGRSCSRPPCRKRTRVIGRRRRRSPDSSETARLSTRSPPRLPTNPTTCCDSRRRGSSQTPATDGGSRSRWHSSRATRRCSTGMRQTPC
jgi:zinc/manganese transport system permease protein